MIRPSPSHNIRLEWRFIASRIRENRPGSPSSLTASMSSVTTRSNGSCRTERMRPPDRCLRSSIQNIGGWLGLSRGTSVRFSLGWLAEAHSSSLRLPRRRSTTWSRAGCWIFSIFSPSIRGAISPTTACRHTASSAMIHSSIMRSNSSLIRSRLPLRYSQPSSASRAVAC